VADKIRFGAAEYSPNNTDNEIVLYYNHLNDDIKYHGVNIFDRNLGTMSRVTEFIKTIDSRSLI